MFKRVFLTAFLVSMLLAANSVQAEVVVLGETPVAEFTLPDGSVLKNAFVWRRSSEGLMIVHDDGQHFLNFQLLPDDWKAAYLGEPDAPEAPAGEQKAYEVSDPYELMPILETIPELTNEGRSFVLRKDADENSVKHAMALGILHSLLSGKADDAKRLILLTEEMELDIESVEIDTLFSECRSCRGKGRAEKDCTTCGGSGKCPKCNGEGRRKSNMGKTSVHCTTCRGEGACAECGTAGSKTSVCRACRGRGKLLEKKYCEAKRDLYVHTVNSCANPDITMSVMQADRDRIIKVFKTMPQLEAGAVDYYVSDAYSGAMDTNILVACTLYSLLKEDLENAERFLVSLNVNYGENTVLDITKYLKPCSSCDGKGAFERDCGECGGSGKCKRCGGDGERDSEFRDKTISCTTCRSSGNCVACKGNAVKKVRCNPCNASGRTFEEERSEIKFKLVINELNTYYLSNKP